MAQLLGCDFSSSPTKRKPIVLAWGQLNGARVVLERIDTCDSLDHWQTCLDTQASWVGGFDLPFGLPRELVQSLGWPHLWGDCMDHYAQLSRTQIRDAFAAFCNARPVGSKFAHRATDGPAGSSPSMKWVNPPVAFMLHAGVPRLRAIGAWFAGLQAARPQGEPRVALEAYPGLLARELLALAGPGGERRSYKSDDAARQTSERLIARKDIVTALEQGRTRLGLRVKLSHAQRDALVDDPRGDRLDAVLCLVQAAWAQTQHQAGASCYGLPDGLDALEGWIVTA